MMDTINFWNLEVEEMKKMQKNMEDDLEKRFQQILDDC